MTGDLEMAFRRAAVALGDECRALQYVANVAHTDWLFDPNDLRRWLKSREGDGRTQPKPKPRKRRKRN